MGASPDLYGAALARAVATVNADPKLLHLMERGEAGALLESFCRLPEVREWLYHLPSAKQHDAVTALLRKAHAWVWEGGEAEKVHALYADDLASGRLAGVSETVVAVHRAVFTLAAWRGTPVLASLRFLSTAARVQSGVDRSAKTVDRALDKLERSGLLVRERGARGIAAASSGRIYVPLDGYEGAYAPADAVIDLAMTDELLLALSDYQQHARRDLRQRSDAAWDRHAVGHRARLAQLERIAAMEWEAAIPGFLEGLEL